MSNKLHEITVVVTSVDIGTPDAMDATPLLGGGGRKALLRIPVLPLTSVFKLQGAPAIDPSTGTTPVEGSVLWTDVTGNIDSSADQIQEITLPELIRWNCTTLDGDGPDVKVYVEGIE
jgi:hypothetical protein